MSSVLKLAVSVMIRFNGRISDRPLGSSRFGRMSVVVVEEGGNQVHFAVLQDE